MSRLKYTAELLCLLLFLCCAFMYGHFIRHSDELTKQLDVLLTLESSLPKHQIQILNANFSDQLHYDNFAQLQSEIEKTLFEPSLAPQLKNLLKRYTDTALNYIQLVTMLKTSQRLVSKQALNENAALTQIIDDIRIELFSFITLPNETTQKNILTLINRAELHEKSDNNAQYWQLFKLHTLFLVNNIEQTAEYRQRLITLPVIRQTLLSIGDKNTALKAEQSNKIFSGVGMALSMLFIFIVILKRQQIQLKETSQAHKKAAEVKTQFLANMSHEIRTPMTGIIGLVDLCLQTPLNAEQQSYLEKVQFSSSSLLTIINDILDFSKIESGKLYIEKVPVVHDKLIDNLNVMLGRVAEEKNIELIFDIDPNIPSSIVTDPVRLNQILLNLLSNAVKFTEHGHVVLRASIISKAAGSHLLYQIEDTGIGLSNEQQSRLFQRFSQADDSTTRKYGGTGLGLAISKLLVDLMKGDIGVESELGKGATFNVSIPLVSTPDAVVPLTNKQYNGLNLLLIEYTKQTQYVAKKMAAYLGVNIDVCATVTEAKALCSKTQYDIALVDWNLKEECGLDFISSIYNEPHCPKSLVVCSAYSKAYIEENSAVNYNLKYLAKPFTLAKFEQLLKTGAIEHQQEFLTARIDNTASEADTTPTIAPSVPSSAILLAEDNKINQIVATKLLQSLGLHVDVAENGEEAIKKIEQGSYTVVLMDIQMPIMDGKEATIQLRKKHPPEELTIIALTANITEEEINEYQSIGMDGHLGKPYELEKMKEALGQHFNLTV
mgnify:FL=1